MSQAAVRIQNLDSGWEVLGKDRFAGIIPDPDSIELSSNNWGSDTARFMLRRDPRMVHPDIAAFTPCEVEIGGIVVWSGRIWETPTKEGSDAGLSIEGRGWQYHLDDDVYARLFVHTRMDDFVDSRGLPSCNLAQCKGGGSVTTDNGVLTMTVPNGTVFANAYYACATLDWGPSPDCWPIRAVATYDSSNNTPNATLYIASSDEESAYPAGTFGTNFQYVNASGVVNNAGASGTTGPTTFSVARRYTHIFINTTGAGTFGADVWFRIKTLLLFSAASYEAGGVSVLKASNVVADALPHAPLLSQSTAKISTTTTSLPEFVFLDPKTPRETVTAINAYHNYRTRVDVDKSLRFDPYPSLPLYEAGSWQGLEFEDASANSGESIYNRALVQATGPDGNSLQTYRTVLEAGGPFMESVTPTPTNPSMDVNTTGWANNNGTATRDTVNFDSAPASLAWAPAAGASTLTATMSGTFRAGVAYRLRWVHKTLVGAPPFFFLAKFGDFTVTPADSANNFFNINNVNYTSGSLTWTPKFTTSAATLVLSGSFAAGTTHSIDSLHIDVGATLIDRRGFTRTTILPIESALTTTSANIISDVYLLNHQTTPLRGNASVQAGGLRGAGTGDSVPPATLLLNTGELIRFTDRVDPDTGGLGRDGRIASVTYRHATEQAGVAIDNERRNFETLLSRLALFSR